ncbi:PepSY domain-containing protein [Halorussus aquaticus]|uniref:PepSY domain-containing protein n=1 Tax=Halorussus aquaticus TaxID=2953748 RepID=A0ABD5PYK4_9EURY|nr:PepSY domain-containing protein [Halorussus aquaticus]
MEYHRIASLGLVLLVVGSLGGVGAATSLSTDAQSQSHALDVTERHERQAGADSAASRPGDRGTNAAQQGGQVNLSAVEVPALEAVRLAQNRTGGKAVVVSLGTRNETPVFNVSVLHRNLSVSQVTVDATDGTVTSVRPNTTVVRAQFLGGEAFDFSKLRTAGEAIRLVRNQTTGTVVNVGLRRGELVYGVALRTPEGRQTQALVTATSGPVLGIQTRNATTTPTTNSS